MKSKEEVSNKSEKGSSGEANESELLSTEKQRIAERSTALRPYGRNIPAGAVQHNTPQQQPTVKEGHESVLRLSNQRRRNKQLQTDLHEAGQQEEKEAVIDDDVEVSGAISDDEGSKDSSVKVNVNLVQASLVEEQRTSNPAILVVAENAGHLASQDQKFRRNVYIALGLIFVTVIATIIVVMVTVVLPAGQGDDKNNVDENSKANTPQPSATNVLEDMPTISPSSSTNMSSQPTDTAEGPQETITGVPTTEVPDASGTESPLVLTIPINATSLWGNRVSCAFTKCSNEVYDYSTAEYCSDGSCINGITSCSIRGPTHTIVEYDTATLSELTDNRLGGGVVYQMEAGSSAHVTRVDGDTTEVHLGAGGDCTDGTRCEGNENEGGFIIDLADSGGYSFANGSFVRGWGWKWSMVLFADGVRVARIGVSPDPGYTKNIIWVLDSNKIIIPPNSTIVEVKCGGWCGGCRANLFVTKQ